jgi:hypothetical protein
MSVDRPPSSWHAKACHPRLAFVESVRRGCPACAEHDGSILTTRPPAEIAA